MTPAPPIHGIIAYPITPFGADGGVDTATLAVLVEKLIAAGVHAIAPLGSTGEAAYLTEGEFDSVVDTTVGTVDHRVPVIVGAGDLTTANTVRRARYAQRVGADAVMILPVSYWKLTPREIAQHYATVGAALDIPIMAYNNPATSGIDMSPELLVQMFNDIDNVTMVKESTGDRGRAAVLQRQQPADPRRPHRRRERLVHGRTQPASAALPRPLRGHPGRRLRHGQNHLRRFVTTAALHRR